MPISYFNGTSDKAIIDLEDHYKMTLPADYKLFLAQHDGCRIISPTYCELKFAGVDDGFIAVDVLFSTKTTNENFSLLSINNEYLEELDFIENAFLIGTDPSK